MIDGAGLGQFGEMVAEGVAAPPDALGDRQAVVDGGLSMQIDRAQRVVGCGRISARRRQWWLWSERRGLDEPAWLMRNRPFAKLRNLAAGPLAGLQNSVLKISK